MNANKPDLRELCRLEYGEAFVEKYDKLNQGIPIGNVLDTIDFLDKLEKLKERGN